MLSDNRIVREVTAELTKVAEGQKQVGALNDQLRNLNDILKNTKQRGILGEYFLETVLKNVTGQIVSCSYALQTAPANPALVDIQEDGMTIPRDTTHTNGWDFGPGDQRKWNEVQNTHRDIRTLANYLLVQYKALVWNQPQRAST